jgi:hypothetical protein
LLERVKAVLLEQLPVEKVLTVFLALRRSRANHKHVARAILGYLLNQPQLGRLVQQRRATLVDLLEHALGRNTARGLVKELAAVKPDGRKLRPLLHHAHDPSRAGAVVRCLYRRGPLPPLPARRVKKEVATVEEEEWVVPKTVTATNRGDIAATLVHLYRGGETPELRQALEQYVEKAARGLPRFEGRLALVLDASASTRGYGEREYSCISQSQALRLVLERLCPDLHVHQVGGNGDPPRPEGATDLASALLEALADEPDLVAIISDGYENQMHGDLADVTGALPATGCDVPVVFCHSKFFMVDDLTQRRPAPRLPELEFWHEMDFGPLVRRLFAQARGQRGREFLRYYLYERLEKLERKIVPCYPNG